MKKLILWISIVIAIICIIYAITIVLGLFFSADTQPIKTATETIIG